MSVGNQLASVQRVGRRVSCRPDDPGFPLFAQLIHSASAHRSRAIPIIFLNGQIIDEVVTAHADERFIDVIAKGHDGLPIVHLGEIALQRLWGEVVVIISKGAAQ